VGRGQELGTYERASHAQYVRSRRAVSAQKPAPFRCTVSTSCEEERQRQPFRPRPHSDGSALMAPAPENKT